VSVSLERFGDRWSLLLIRDMMVRGYKTFKEFEESGEGIATNILANRLERLRAAGIIATEQDDTDGRRVIYRLTEKGIDLAPVLLELLIWSARHEETAAPCEVMAHMEGNRAAVIEEVRRRWRERDPVPFLPPFASDGGGKKNRAGKKMAEKKRTTKGAEI
jgi:DNA-binding HxlR family transcriptional regulator